MRIPVEKWRELIGHLEVLKTYYARLTERERYIVLGIGAGGVVFLMLLILGSMWAATARLASKIDSQGYLSQMNDLKSSYLQTEGQIRRMENMIQRSDPNFQLATELEKMARRHGVAIESIKDRPGPPNDLYQETQASVSIKQITVKNLTDFLFEIENARQLLRITSLQVRPGFQDPTQLNVSFVVSTFQPGRGS